MYLLYQKVRGNMETKKIVDMLTADSVSILTQKFMKDDGEIVQVGKNHRKGYVNSGPGRAELQEKEPPEVVEAVLAIWGDTPTVEYSMSEYIL